MGINKIGTPIDIAVSGLRAEAMKMNVIANNIANASTTRTASGQPYRRQEVVLSTGNGLNGVTIKKVMDDTKSDFSRVFEPGNPDAAEDGYVSMPNVQLPVELMNMVVANRSYQANAAVLKRYMEAADVTMELLR